MAFSGGGPSNPQINVTPLIDVLLVLIIVRQRRHVASTGIGVMQVPSMPFGSYPNQGQPGAFSVNYPTPLDAFQPVPATPAVSGVYPPTPASYGAQDSAVSGSGVYPPTPASYGAPEPGTYTSSPVSYASAAWYEQSTSPVPQTPLEVVPETPLPWPEEQAVVDLPVADDEVVHPHTHEYLLPTWVPTVEIEEHDQVSPVSMHSEFLVEARASDLVKQEEFPGMNGAVFINPLQSSDGWPTFREFLEDQQTFVAAQIEVPEQTAVVTQAEEAPVVTPSEVVEQTFVAAQEETSSVVSSEVVEQTVFATQEKATIAGSSEENELTLQSSPGTWVAPCGHSNASGVRFCRVCGQPVQPEQTQDSNVTL